MRRRGNMNIQETLNILTKKPSNLALAFYKTNIFTYLKNKAKGNRTVADLLKFIGDKNSEVKDIEKKVYLKDLIKNVELEDVNNILKRISKLPESFKDKYEVESVKAKVGYRFVSGMGYPSPIENGFLLHHTYGIPYISGESVKGLVRFMYIYKRFLEEDVSKEKLEEAKKRIRNIEERNYKEKELKDTEKRFIKLFGNQREEGKVIFFDAYP
ncbi:MAG: type III-B CRISPR module RAMP protein Cmr6 [Aquificota bacterium]|nr:type III-B CRISPR module RAMP protein Cmr6 [Aquificota bacterium]